MNVICSRGYKTLC